MALTGGRGVDTAIEAVGIPATFTLCEDVVAAGGTVANVGVHGSKVDLHPERLRSHNVTITKPETHAAHHPPGMASQ
jgi:alcohol dehydrogenase